MTKASKEGQRKAPILRFKGFTDDWEQRKLGNLFNERKERSTEGELLSVTLSNGVTKFSDLNKKDNSNIKSGNYKIVKRNDIPYNSMRMWQGASGVSSYDGIVSPAYTVLIPNKNSNSNFYAVLFKKKSILNLFTRFSQGLTSDTWNLKYPILKDINVPFTNLEEQKRIFKIFNVVNNLLALYDRKTKLIKQIQSSFLDCFFSETNNVTSLNHFLRIRNGYAFKSSELTENGEIPVVKISNIGSNKPFTFTTKAKSKEQFTLYPNDIIIALSGATAGKINQVANKYPLYYQNQRVGFFEIKNDRLNCEYLNSFLHSKKFKSQLQKTLVAGAQPNITPKDIEKIKIPFLEYELQQTIGQVNKYLFELQRINKDKLTLLNKIKKTLLNNMFV